MARSHPLLDLRSVASPNPPIKETTLSIEKPTDKHCGDYEYVANYQGGRFIVNTQGEYRLHPSEIPDEFRTPPPFNPLIHRLPWSWIALGWASTLLIIKLLSRDNDPPLIFGFASFWVGLAILVIALLTNQQNDSAYIAWKAKKEGWTRAYYRDHGVSNPQIWLSTTSYSIESPSATWGL